MLVSEIDSLCAEVATSTGLPVEWVLHHVHAKAGRPCRRCGGSGIVKPGACFRCRGSGGRASHVGVMGALDWVRANVDRVRALGEKREAAAPGLEAAHRREAIVASEAWKRDHADVWEFLDGMLDGDFRRSMLRAVEEARVTEAQVEALRKMMAAQKRRDSVAPDVGSRVDAKGRLTSARHWSDPRGGRVFRVEFETEHGWRGRVDTTDPKTVNRIQGRRRDAVVVRGRVVWKRDGFAILSDLSEILLDG